MKREGLIVSREIHRSQRRFNAKNVKGKSRVRRAIIESLEERQLLSLTIDVRAADGSKAVSVSTVGQVVTLNVFADIQGQSASPAGDGMQDLQGSFLGTNVGFGPLAGDLAAQTISPFADSGSTTGISQDLNSDGNKDVGGTDPSNDSGYFFARAASPVMGAFEFKVATLTYTVKSLNFGGEVDVNYFPRTVSFGQGRTAVWFEDGSNESEFSATLLEGASVKITDAAAQPVGPVAVNDISNALTAQPDTIPVLNNDVDFTGTIIKSSVDVTVPPNHGGTTVLDPATGILTYTSAPTFFGTETFSYTIADSNGAASPPATVTVSVQPPLPQAANDTVNTLFNTPVVAHVLDNDAAAIGIQSGSVTLATQPTNGTAVVNSDGTITYTPKTGFIGGDTLKYTFKDNNNTVSTIGTVTLSTGVEISSAKGGAKSVTYLDVSGTTGVITLNRGVADINFSGSGTFTNTRGKIVVSGASISVSDIILSGTTAASALAIRGVGGTGIVPIGGIQDTAALGRVSAPTVNLTGAVSLASVTALQFSSALGATVTISGGANVTVTCGALNNSTIAAPTASLGLRAGSLNSSTISGLTGKALQFGGNVSGSTVTFTRSVASVKIVGGLSGNSSLVIGAPVRGTVSLGQLTVAGAISNSTVKAAGDISAVTAASMSGDTITAGVPASTTLPNASVNNLGSNRIGSIHLIAKAGTFSSSTILADSITSATLGAVTTANSGVQFGLAAEQIKSVSAIINGAATHLSTKQLVAPGLVFGDFRIDVL